MMPIRTIAIACLTVREAVRSKLLLSLAILLVAGLIGLPLLIAGDNTLSGKIQVILTYTLGFATTILSITTLWTACGGFSKEIQDRRLYLVITKPLHRYELWLGKWLGMLTMNLGLLALTGITISVMAHQTIHRSTDSLMVKRQVSEQFLMARQGLQPLTPDWSDFVKKTTQRLIESGRLQEKMMPAVIQQKLIEELSIKRFTIPPGGGAQFSFKRPETQENGHDLLLSYKFDSTRPERSPVAARWTMGTNPEHQIQVDVTNYPGVPAILAVINDETAGTNILTFTYQRLDTNSQATLLMADRTQAPELLVPYGSFGMNLIRGLFIILCRLAFLAALGLMVGCLLSTPVAVFAAFFIIILVASSGYVESVATSGVFFVPHEGPASEQTWLNQSILHLFRVFHVVTQPLTKLDPVPLLATGRVVSGQMTLQALVWLAGLYSAITALIGITLFNRRELG
jgi:ABC-type transport system involved in multi-copper enzyme maturation permease subunit